MRYLVISTDPLHAAHINAFHFFSSKLILAPLSIAFFTSARLDFYAALTLLL